MEVANSMTFAGKYRPTDLSGYMGPEIRNILLKRLESEDKYPKTMLMYGTRGCGKTTAARLVAKELLCLSKVDGHACGKCEMCEEITEKLILSEAGNEALNVLELDVAKDSNKAAIQEAIEWALEEPIWPSKRKVVIFDECHQASINSQNSLLKIAEESPSFLHMIFCTTDKDKMIQPLRDRCGLQIQVKKANLDELIENLLEGCKKEGITTSKEALRIIVNSQDRNPRLCWNALEQIAKNNDYVVQLEQVSKFVGDGDSALFLEYFQASNRGLEDILKVTAKIKESGMELPNFLDGLTKFVLTCVNIRYGMGINDYPKEFLTKVNQFFKEYEGEHFDTLLQIVEYANASMSQANRSPEMAELLINNTALRIGKIRLLSIGLQNEQQKALLENRLGNSRSIEKTAQEAVSINELVTKEKVQGEMLQAVFGAKVREVKLGSKVELEDESIDTQKDAMTDEQLLEFLGG